MRMYFLKKNIKFFQLSLTKYCFSANVIRSIPSGFHFQQKTANIWSSSRKDYDSSHDFWIYQKSNKAMSVKFL